MEDKKDFKVALIDMNKGMPNLGITSIKEIVCDFAGLHQLNLSLHTFDLRAKNEIPDMEHDIYISSGGPGSPFDGRGKSWENSFFELLDRLAAHNTTHQRKKFVFFICHSFQLACRKYNTGTVTKRNAAALGIFPLNLTEKGEKDLIYAGLANPFYVVDSRAWQVVGAGQDTFDLKEAAILALEKERPAVDLERCIMSVRFSKEMIGTQFHPEADPQQLRHLKNPDLVKRTRQLILPNFLTDALQSLNHYGHDQ
jgi:GMP synthase-like glutamine amidotransferase